MQEYRPEMLDRAAAKRNADRHMLDRTEAMARANAPHPDGNRAERRKRARSRPVP